MLKENVAMLFCGGALICVGVYYTSKKIKALKKEIEELKSNINVATDEASKQVSVNVSDEFIEKAVDKAVSRESSYQIRKAINDISADVKSDMRKQVKSSIAEAYGDTKVLVAEELKRQIGNLSIESIRKEVMVEAKKEAAAKFKQDLDVVLEKHNQQLNDVTAIYSSNAKSMRGDK